MVKMLIAVTRLPGLSRAEFQQYWRREHALLVKSVADALGIRRYVQLCSLPDHSLLVNSPQLDCDGIAEIWFDSLETLTVKHRQPNARQALNKLREDEQRFIDRSRSLVFWGSEQVII